MWMRHTRTSVTPLRKQPKRLFHAGIEITIFRVGMQSVNPSIKPFCSLLRETTQVWLLQLCLPSLTESEGIDGPKQFGAHSSRKAWSILNNLTGRSRHSPRHCLISTNAIASQLVRNEKYEAVDRKSSRLVFQEMSDLWRAATPDAINISDNFSQKEFAAALQHLKPGKAPGPDSICPEHILHAGAALKSWLRDFISSCLRRLKISKIWRRALVVAIPKPGKPMGDPKSYRPISLLCVPYKILKRLIYARVEPLIDPLLPKEQAGFRRRKSTIDQVVLLTQNIEDSFEAKKKAGAVFIDLTAAYDTVWHRGLTCKLLRLLPDKHMVKMIIEVVRNRSFTLTTGDSKQSRLRRPKNGVPQGSVLAPLLFNIYTYDLPSTISRKFAYADDLALLHSSGNWKDLEGTLSQDMSTLSAYLQTWRLKLSHIKTVTTAFHLNNREAKRELKVYNNGRLLPFCPTPTYLGVKLDRSLTFRHHLVALRKKLRHSKSNAPNFIMYKQIIIATCIIHQKKGTSVRITFLLLHIVSVSTYLKSYSPSMNEGMYTSVVQLSRLMSKPIQDSSFHFIVIAISVAPESFFHWTKEVVV